MINQQIADDAREAGFRVFGNAEFGYEFRPLGVTCGVELAKFAELIIKREREQTTPSQSEPVAQVYVNIDDECEQFDWSDTKPQPTSQDSERLDKLQALTKGYGKGWILRDSGIGRGMRLHETDQDGASPTVREAIDAMKEAGL